MAKRRALNGEQNPVKKAPKKENPPALAPSLSVEDVAARHHVVRDTVWHWIDSSELAAINVAKHKNAKRPSWRITEEALAAFELARQTVVVAPKQERQKKQNNAATKHWFR